jgi:hypothetical protein
MFLMTEQYPKLTLRIIAIGRHHLEGRRLDVLCFLRKFLINQAPPHARADEISPFNDRG